MALVERLCQVDEDQPGGEPNERHMALNPFCEALMSVLGGYHTVNQVKTFWNMTPEDEVEMDMLVSRVTNYPQMVDRLLAVHRIRSIMTFWEEGNITGYTTVTDIRSQLNAI